MIIPRPPVRSVWRWLAVSRAVPWWPVSRGVPLSEIDNKIDNCRLVSNGVPWCPVESEIDNIDRE
eukprot:9469479-Pyramimonas_sp.AAC.1